VRTVMGEPGKAMMGTAVSSGPDRARIAAEQAVACPLLEGIDLSGAKGVLVLISAAKGSLKLSESKMAMNTIRAYASPDAHVIYGTAYDDELGEEIRVTVVATGLSRQPARRTAPPLQVLRTGTDNLPVLNMAVGQMAQPDSKNTKDAAEPSRMGTSSAVMSMNKLSMPRPAQADMRCSTVKTLALPTEMVDARRVSVTAKALMGMSTGCGKSTRRKTMPVLTGAGRKVSSTRCPLCRPTPTALVRDLRVLWASMAAF